MLVHALCCRLRSNTIFSLTARKFQCCVNFNFNEENLPRNQIDIVKSFDQLGYNNHENTCIRGISYSFIPEAPENKLTPPLARVSPGVPRRKRESCQWIITCCGQYEKNAPRSANFFLPFLQSKVIIPRDTYYT